MECGKTRLHCRNREAERNPKGQSEKECMVSLSHTEKQSGTLLCARFEKDHDERGGGRESSLLQRDLRVAIKEPKSCNAIKGTGSYFLCAATESGNSLYAILVVTSTPIGGGDFTKPAHSCGGDFNARTVVVTLTPIAGGDFNAKRWWWRLQRARARG